MRKNEVSVKEKKAMDKCVVDRSKWCHGRKEQYGFPKLLNNNGNMCCLGFWSKQVLGATDEEILDHELPESLSGVPVLGTDWIAFTNDGYDGQFCPVQVPDERTRERWLIKAFKEVLDCELTFVGRRKRK